MTSLKFLKCVSLYSFLVVQIFALTVIIQSMTTSANAGTTLYSCEIFGGGGGGPNDLFTIDPSDGSSLTTVEMSLSGAPITKCNGLARDPTTGTCWVMVQVNPADFGTPIPGNRILGTINPDTGVITSIGFPDLAIASIAFDDSGTLFGVTGDGGDPSETLHTLSKVDATPIFFQMLGNGANGEAIAFNPIDGLMYHLSGDTDGDNKVFETIDLTTMAVTNITITGDVDCKFETLAIVHQSGSTFLQADLNSALFSITDSGVCTKLGVMDHSSKGLAFDCEPPECVVDGDCEPSGDVCAPNICESSVCVPDPIPDCCEVDVDCGDENECTIDVCENPGPASMCSNDFDVEDDVCFCGLDENALDPRCFTPSGPLVIIPTMGQWGMIIATILLGFFAVYRLIRMKDSEI